ncbi:MAG: glycosyltransferase [Candidatus Niyogibacteria bacterium]|nr:glycosyltransferase [Candidatus Niyogibacteria bacterium]
MKGVILAGGKGTRLHPFTHITNKHLLPVYNKPVIYYAVEKLALAGIEQIMIVTSPEHVDNFIKILGSGENFIFKKTAKPVKINYGIQKTPGGIAEGLHIAKDYVGKDDCILYLGDNVIEEDISEHIKNFKDGATVFLKEVNDPWRFGIATVASTGAITEIIEKPKNPPTNLAVVGIYIYDNSVFKKMVGQPKSDRGEYEITYINNKYIEEGKLKSVLLEKKWFDIGTIDSLLEAGNFIRSRNLLCAKVKSLSILLTCFNDKGTAASVILEAKKIAQSLTDDFEIIVVDDGSSDGSRELFMGLAKNIPELKLVFHESPKGHGAALRDGFRFAAKDIVFYTDGDGQYDINELYLLVEKLDDNVDMVNSYKVKKIDPLRRIVIGYIYQQVAKWFFWLPIKDPDCDFRLIRRKVLDSVELKSDSGTITIELIKKIQRANFRLVEVGISHYSRTCGPSQFFTPKRIAKAFYRLAVLWFDLFLKRGTI